MPLVKVVKADLQTTAMSSDFVPEWDKDQSQYALMYVLSIGICKPELWQKVVAHALYYGIATKEQFEAPEPQEPPKLCPEMKKALQKLETIKLEESGIYEYMQALHIYIRARADCYGLG